MIGKCAYSYVEEIVCDPLTVPFRTVDKKGIITQEKHGNNNNQLLEECLVVSVGVVISVR